MSVKVHEAFSIDSFQDRLLWWDDFLGDQLKDEWDEAGTGSAAVIDAQTGGIVRLTTGGADNDNYSIDWNNYRSLLVSKKVTFEARIKLQTTSSINTQFGLYSAFADIVKFEYDTDAAETNWRIEVRNGGAITNGDSGIAVDTDYHIFRIEAFPTDEVHYYIDGVECANSPLTTNIPPDYLQPFLYVRTRETATKYIDIDYVVVRQEI